MAGDVFTDTNVLVYSRDTAEPDKQLYPDAIALSFPPKVTPGFCGKLSSHGDFVTRRLPRSFVAP